MSVFLLRLKRETSPQHTAIERQIDLRHVCGSRSAYTQHLARLYGFYRPLEKALWRTSAVREAGLGEERRKTPLLLDDLRALRAAPLAALPLCEALPPVAEDAQALGCLYVLEGASLGGRVITRLVRERLGIGPGDGGAFFHGYGEATGAMWDSFRASLDAYARSPERQEAVIGAARATFDALGAWLAAGEGGTDA